VEKIDNEWKIRRDDGGEVVQEPPAPLAADIEEEHLPATLPTSLSVGGGR
jgi:hypothetical protein